jgi:Tol biopolymer transport system component/DNA-binding winged helix-turn-helix (wHTH) protein
MSIGEKQIYRFGPFQLDTQSGQLKKNSVGLKLQGQPIQILELLLEKAGELVTREEIRQRLWATDTFVDFDHSLNTAVKKLRQTLGDEVDNPLYIETLPKRGYSFIAEVSREPKETRDPASGKRADAELPGAAPWKRAVIVGAVVALLAVAASVPWIFNPPPQPRIVSSHVLTKTGGLKSFSTKPLVDRGIVYFSEQLPSGTTLLQVPAAGGEVSPGPKINGYLNDISRDGSRVLSHTSDSNGQCDVWTDSLPPGSSRLTVKDSCFAVWSADGRSIFFVRSSNKDSAELYRANADGTEARRIMDIETDADLHVSPDGSRIRFGASDNSAFTLWEAGADGSNPHRILGGRKDVIGGTWSPDRKHYFFTTWDGDHWSLGAVSEAHHWWQKTQPLELLTFGPLSVGNPAVSSDGKTLYAVGREPRGELSVYDAKSRKFVPFLSGSSICYVDFSRDCQWITYVTYPEGTLWRSRIDGGERRQLTVPPLAAMNPRWSPDGKLIAFIDLSNGDRHQMNDTTPRRIYAISAEGGAPELLAAGQVGDPAWSPDGTSIAYAADNELRVLNLQSQKSEALPASRQLWSVRWSPDGKYLVALEGDTARKLKLFTFATNNWTELASGTDFGWPSWSHDSKFVYAQDDETLVRISIADRKKEQIASLMGFRSTAYYLDRWNTGWLGLTPDDRPITTRDTGVQEIYAFELEYK